MEQTHAERFAEHLERHHWYVAPIDLPGYTTYRKHGQRHRYYVSEGGVRRGDTFAASHVVTLIDGAIV